MAVPPNYDATIQLRLSSRAARGILVFADARRVGGASKNQDSSLRSE
jgi:hypothetical protein